MRGRGLQLLRCLGLVLGFLYMLAGCGGNSGSSDTSGAVSRGRPLSLELQLQPQHAPQAASASRRQGLASAQVRQVQPGAPGFIERFEVRLQAQGSDFAPPQVFTLDSTEQETATRDVTVPDTAPATFQVLVSAFNPQGIEVYRGDTTIALGQTSAVVPLLRAALVPVPATPANLQQTTFTFTDGAIFGLANVPVTLATGTFEGNEGDFALTANGSVASGSVVIGSCTFVVTTSTFPAGQGLQVGDRFVLDPCQIDAIDRRLIVTNAAVSSTPTISSPPVSIPPDTTLNLPTSPPLVIDEDTSGSLQISASVSGTRPGTIALGITIPPAHGTATLTNTGVVTYQPVANFNGSDRLVVTVVVSFTDNSSPALLLGTVPIPITVQPVNDAPAPTAPGISTPQNTPVTSQISANDSDAGQTPTFSISPPPTHGTATVSPTGLATYTPAPGFSGVDSFVVTVTDNGIPPLSGTVTIAVTVLAPPNRAPAPTAPGISTPQNTPGTSQINANDPDAGQKPTFSISPPPTHGTATVSPTGLATYTPAPGFSGVDSFVVTVTDNGIPPLSGTVTIAVTVLAPSNRAPAPTAPGISTPQNTPGTSQINANDPDAGQTPTFSISPPPTHGTATVSPTGLATYTPAPGFSGVDSFVVTVTDNGIPPLAGTVTIAVTVLASSNRAPGLTNPGAQSNAEGDKVGLQLNASDPDGNVLTFSTTSLPPGLNIDPATGLISGTLAFGAATSIPFSVTVTVTDNGTPPLSASVSFPWNIAPSVPLNTVRIVSPLGPVSAGTIFPVTVQVNTGATNVLSYLFELTFDPTVVVVTNITQGSLFFEVPIRNPAAFTTGTVQFAANNPTFTPANGVLTLATITFHVIGSPGTTAPLKLQFPPLSNSGAGVLVDDIPIKPSGVLRSSMVR